MTIFGFDENQLLILGLALILIWITHTIIQLIINRNKNKKALSPDVVNGLRVGSRFLVAIAVLWSSVAILELGESTTLNLSIFLGSLVSFASIYTIQNFVAGLYLMLTRPFKVNDLVKIGGTEGVVTEISLNYTKVLDADGVLEYIPNKNILGSTIINYDQKIPDIKEKEGENWLGKLKEVFDDDDLEITRYTFVYGAPLESMDELQSKLDEVCDKFTEVFGFRPSYVPYKLNFSLQFYFVLRAYGPMTILKNKPDFLDAINLALY